MFYADNSFFFFFISDNSIILFLYKLGNRQSIGASSSKSISNLIRPISPKSPALSASFNESDEDETFLEDSKFDDNNAYLHTNGNMVKFIQYISLSYACEVFQNTY